ncbi:LysR family transcriptional regulator [Roseomonas sp. GC11]|uniref:LysR family transcriptional regulator n=1 Tax=Roseomonas sp. GC11 TaxID=2950546 RepID=UPI00210BD562|nr:LysR family transcriptional regulator [Roseomonas sp. GC11]MCQ4158614.1 LysR family transcriptional regulator [Roseomonas sp. GC11]
MPVRHQLPRETMAPPVPRIHAPALQYFDAVRRAGSIREAARRLNIASSAVNRQILKLEEELGAPLFDRLPAGLRLTPAGEVLAGHVVTVLRDLERAASELDALRGLGAGHVEIIAPEGACHRLLPAALRALHAGFPGLSFGAGIAGAAEIPRRLAEGEAHLALAFEVRRQAELREIAAVRLRLGAVMRADAPLAGRQSVTLAECQEQAPLILPKANFANRDQLHPLFAEARLRARAAFEAGSVELMRQMVAAGLGIAFLTPIGIEAALEAGELVHVPLRHRGGPVLSRFGLYARAGTALPVAAGAAAAQIAALLRGHAPGEL